MINTLDDYIRRSLPEEGDFVTNRNLEKKVDENGKLLPFRGNTTVFLLDEKTKLQLLQLQQELYDGAGEMLAQRLDPDTFHMTLHDLINGPAGEPGLDARMAQAEALARPILAQWRDQTPLTMRATWMFNMVNTSIVLGLAPADGDSWRRLDAMYMQLEKVVPLGYGLSPHITLAYFRPGVYSQQELQGLRKMLHAVDLELQLRMTDLVFQNFEDMNHYVTAGSGNDL